MFSKKFNHYIWLILTFRISFVMFNYSVNFFTDTTQKHLLINNIFNLSDNSEKEINISFLYY